MKKEKTMKNRVGELYPSCSNNKLLFSILQTESQEIIIFKMMMSQNELKQAYSRPLEAKTVV